MCPLALAVPAAPPALAAGDGSGSGGFEARQVVQQHRGRLGRGVEAAQPLVELAGLQMPRHVVAAELGRNAVGAVHCASFTAVPYARISVSF